MYSRAKEKLKSGELIVAGDQWPIFLYSGYIYDLEDPWNGLFCSAILVLVSCLSFTTCDSLIMTFQAYKHIFTSPSSVDKDPKATRSGNARIHGMTNIMLPSIAYVATQVRLISYYISDINFSLFRCALR